MSFNQIQVFHDGSQDLSEPLLLPEVPWGWVTASLFSIFRFKSFLWLAALIAWTKEYGWALPLEKHLFIFKTKRHLYRMVTPQSRSHIVWLLSVVYFLEGLYTAVAGSGARDVLDFWENRPIPSIHIYMP